MINHNQLARETSPYLLQHADNPVHWLPWGESALKAARCMDRPILLSVGYSACHWCHVMAHESFEHEATAARMNELFVNIKVDREERPDIDKIYQLAHQLLTRRAGGWPLTVFLTPDDHTPFFAGTYFPLAPRHGMPSFGQVLEGVAQYYRTHRNDVREQRTALLSALQSMEPDAATTEILSPEPLVSARNELARSFDTTHGGFGDAPKFPHPSNLTRLLRHYAATATGGQGDEAALAMAITTLRRMAQSGIYDQLGGGFCRYSVDAVWMIPHFEKMLYDNGPLLALLAEAYQMTGERLFAEKATQTAEWVMREMQAQSGGYHSTLDADSEGEEGKFYVWSRQEVQSLLDADEYAVFARHFGLDRSPNFENHAWHLHTFVPLVQLADELNIKVSDAEVLINSARAKLLSERNARVWPGLDDKILSGWNGLMIRGMCVAARVLARDDLVDSATRAIDYVREHMRHGSQLLATARAGRAHLDAYLDDHALLLDACLALLECRWRRVDLDFAIELADTLLERFEDREHGGFFFTAHDHEPLIHRMKPMMDDALPAGNAVAALALMRLGHLLGELRYLDAAERTIRVAWDGLQRYPHAHTALLDALEEQLYPPQTIIIRGTGEALQQWHERAKRYYSPRRMCVAIPECESDLPGVLTTRDNAACLSAYLCEGHQCLAPVTDYDAFERALQSGELTPIDADFNATVVT